MVVKISGDLRSLRSTLSRVASSSLPVWPHEHQGAPGDAEGDAQGGLVGAVAADVADDHVHGAVGGLDRVPEVAREERLPAPGQVAGLVLQAFALELLLQHGHGQQAVLQPGVLAAEVLGVGQLALGEVGALALDGVADGAGE